MASPNDPSDVSGELIAASQVSGTSVFDGQGQKLGSVLDVMIDKASGHAAYAILSFGGFLGIGDRRHPLPWAALRYDPALGGYVVDIDRRTLEGAPAYDADEAVSWSDAAWGRQVRDYYALRPASGAAA